MGALAIAYGKNVYWQGPYATDANLDSSSLSVSVLFRNVGVDGIMAMNTSGWSLCVLGGTNNCSLSGSSTISGSTGDWLPAYVHSYTNESVTVVQQTARPLASAENLLLQDKDATVLIRYAWESLPFKYKQAGIYAKKELYPAGPFVLVTSK